MRSWRLAHWGLLGDYSRFGFGFRLRFGFAMC